MDGGAWWAAIYGRAVVGQPEGQRHLRAGGRCFLAARSKRGGPEDLGRGEAGGPHCQWMDGKLASPAGAQASSAWPRAQTVEEAMSLAARLHSSLRSCSLGDVRESSVYQVTSRDSGNPFFQLGIVIILVASCL